MEAYQSLSNRMTSMEDLLRRSESNVAMLLQRVKVLEEYVSTNTARSNGANAARSDEIASRLEKVIENQNGKFETIQNAILRQGAGLQVVEEKFQGSLKAIEQKINSDVAGCYQRLQGSENSLISGLRNVESAIQAQSSSLKSLEQNLRGDIVSLQQKTSGELLNERQRIDSIDNTLRNALTEMHRSISGDLRSISDKLFENLQSSTQAINGSLVGLDQKFQTEIKSVQDSLLHEIAVDRQTISTQSTNTRDSLQALHNTLGNDIASLSSRIQSIEANHQLAHQQFINELSVQRQNIDTVDVNWRTSLTDLNNKLQESLQNVLGQVGKIDVSLQQRITHTSTRIDEVSSELQRRAESIAHSLQVKINSLEYLREDIIRNKNTLSNMHDDHQRLRDEIRSFATVAERSAMQLRTMIEAAVRASHSDLMERMKPLTSYRTEMNTAITAALNKLWNEANDTFTSQRDAQAIQNQIMVLDNAVRNEVSLLAEKGRVLEKRKENNQNLDSNEVKTSGGDGALVKVPVLGELNNVWNELRNIQQRLGMPKEEVLNTIENTRKELLDAALKAATKSENEFRSILSQIQNDVRDLIPQVPRETSVVGRYENSKSNRPKKTIVRVVPKNSSYHHPSSPELPPIVRVNLPTSQDTQILQEEKSQKKLVNNSGISTLPTGDKQNISNNAEVVDRLPPLMRETLPPSPLPPSIKKNTSTPVSGRSTSK